jgi:hypothetical protein
VRETPDLIRIHLFYQFRLSPLEPAQYSVDQFNGPMLIQPTDTVHGFGDRGVSGGAHVNELVQTAQDQTKDIVVFRSQRFAQQASGYSLQTRPPAQDAVT